jgi:hypothetical protein
MFAGQRMELSSKSVGSVKRLAAFLNLNTQVVGEITSSRLSARRELQRPVNLFDNLYRENLMS